MKTILITGAAKRGGAAIARKIHQRGFRVILHCRSRSLEGAEQLHRELNASRHESAVIWSQELGFDLLTPPLVDSVAGIVANASSYRASNLDTFDNQLNEDSPEGLKEGFNYATIYEIICTATKTKTYLLETIANHIADSVMANRAALTCMVRISKTRCWPNAARTGIKIFRQSNRI